MRVSSWKTESNLTRSVLFLPTTDPPRYLFNLNHSERNLLRKLSDVNGGLRMLKASRRYTLFTLVDVAWRDFFETLKIFSFHSDARQTMSLLSYLILEAANDSNNEQQPRHKSFRNTKKKTKSW